MKKTALILFAAAALLSGLNAYAQTSRFGHGKDSADCVTYLSYYQEYWKQKNYDSALPNWRKAYSVCPPTASQNMFIHGTTLMTRLYGQTKDPAMKAAIADTILTLQDQRMTAYPKSRTTVLNNKGQYIVNYKASDDAFMYENLGAIVDELGPLSKGGLNVNLLQAAVSLYRENKLSADEVIATYDKVSANVENANAKNDAEKEDNLKAKATIESIFADSKVASCENLLNIFGPRYEADPNNLTLVSNIVRLMNSADDCSSNDLYLNAVTSMYRLDPSYKSAYGLYRLNAARGNDADACRYLEEAIASDESDAAVDAQYYYELAAFAYKNGMRNKASEAARKAVEMDYGYAGKAYMIIGNLWASAPCAGDVDKYARYWAATDYYQKARNADPTISEDAGRAIAAVSGNYPPAAEIFMYDLTAGQSYTVNCNGMSAYTTVRVSNR